MLKLSSHLFVFIIFLLFVRRAKQCDKNRSKFERVMHANPINLENKLTLIEILSLNEKLEKIK